MKIHQIIEIRDRELTKRYPTMYGAESLDIALAGFEAAFQQMGWVTTKPRSQTVTIHVPTEGFITAHVWSEQTRLRDFHFEKFILASLEYDCL